MRQVTDQSTLPQADAEKKYCKKELKKIKKELFSLQNKFIADGRFGLLIILQGVDTLGKDGTIIHAFSAINPMVIQVTSFKKPLAQVLEYNFLWRIYPHFPAKGIITAFNRSYYEYILVPSVNKTLSKANIHHRCRIINELEHHLVRNDIQILKFFPNISADVQKERKNKPHKKWKYTIADEKAPKEWSGYIKSYSMLVENCNQFPGISFWRTNVVFAILK